MPNPAGTLPSQVLPYRVTCALGLLFISVAQFTDGNYDQPASPTVIADPGNLFGPVLSVEIEDPVVNVRQTAIGDPGDENRPIRKGSWTLRATAITDISDGLTTGDPGDPIYGDYRWGSLQHQTVDFIVLNDNLFGVVAGVGVFEGRIQMPIAEGGSYTREIEIRRRFGNVYGNLAWANIKDGSFA